MSLCKVMIKYLRKNGKHECLWRKEYVETTFPFNKCTYTFSLEVTKVFQEKTDKYNSRQIHNKSDDGNRACNKYLVWICYQTVADNILYCTSFWNFPTNAINVTFPNQTFVNTFCDLPNLKFPLLAATVETGFKFKNSEKIIIIPVFWDTEF